MTALLLTADELSQLTGAKHARRQRAWLEERGIPYRDGAAQRILVSRAAVERWLCGMDARPSRGPNLALVS